MANDPNQIMLEVAETVAGELGKDELRTVSSEATLDELGISSMELAMVLIALEEKFGIYFPADERVSNIRTVGDVVSEIERLINERKTSK